MAVAGVQKTPSIVHGLADGSRLDDTGQRAVIRYSVDARQCTPWFLVVEQARWRLDLATAQRALRFGSGNAWHFAAGAAGASHPYTYAFADWRFDHNGYPHTRVERSGFAALDQVPASRRVGAWPSVGTSPRTMKSTAFSRASTRSYSSGERSQ